MWQIRAVLAIAMAAQLAACGGGGQTTSGAATSPASASSLTLSSSVLTNGGSLPPEYTCDGKGGSPDLSWMGAPANTQEFAILMSTQPGDGSTKWNWVLWAIPAGLRGLPKDSLGVGLAGIGSDGPYQGYQAPCSSGPGEKRYTFTVYALSGSPAINTTSSQLTGDQLLQAMTPLILGSASLTVGYTRNQLGSSLACETVRNSLVGSNSGAASVSCDADFAYVSSQGIASHTMMNGITATNLQVPVVQNFQGANAWRIPLSPAIAAATTTAVDGPVGIAINGVPIFNPCKQGGCQYGDTKALGELDACNGHAGRADDYHYHAAPVCLMAGRPSAYWDTHPLGWALDGFAIFGYHDADGTTAERDQVCGGNTKSVSNAPSGYSYHVTDTSPYVLSCFRGTPSPDLAGQAAKYHPMRQPPVTPFGVSNMSLSTSADGYQVVGFDSSQTFVTTETGTDSHINSAGSYRIRYRLLSGQELVAALQGQAGKSTCWQFQFQTAAGVMTQPNVIYCR